MSWDIFVQDLPREAQTIHDIPDDFRPQPIGKRSEIIQKILEVVPFADFSDPAWGVIDGPDFAIEVNIGDNETVTSFAFHVRGGDTGAGIVADILDHLKLRALDTHSESHFFERENAVQSLSKWREYRDQVINHTSITMKTNKKTEIVVILLLSVIIIAAVVYLWVDGMAGVPEIERQEAHDTLIFFTVSFAFSSIFTLLIGKLLGWFKVFGNDEREHDNVDDS